MSYDRDRTTVLPGGFDYNEVEEPRHSRHSRHQRGYRGHRARRSRTRRVLAWLGVIFLVLIVALAGSAYALMNHYNGNIKRIPNVFAGVTNRPAVVAPGAMNILLAGSDSRAGTQTTGKAGTANAVSPIGQRSDTMMIVHIPADRKSAYVISIPRDSWVNIPGHGQAKINAAFSWGGPSLMIQTVEQLTGIHIDHFAEIDFAGFQAMTDAVGGVDINVPINSYDFYRQKQWYAGMQHMNGAEALLYVRQRAGLPGGDFDRIKHQHQFLAALMSKVMSSGTLTNPIALNNLINAVTNSVSVDSGMTAGDIRSLALSMRSLRKSDVHMFTAPVTGTGTSADGQSIVVLNQAQDKVLWQAVRTDKMAGYQLPPSPYGPG